MNDATKSKSEERSARPDRLDSKNFERQVEPFRRELRLHCYRMTGSSHEAEDLVQETLLRAWRNLGSVDRPGSLRAWLYRIATNACLDALDSRKAQHRLLPDQHLPPAHEMPSGDPPTKLMWLTPYPDSHLEGIADGAPGPAARYETRESVQLAFVALIQQLPPRLRAAVLLCDVLGWSAVEAASLLGGSSASINSALQRARATLSTRYPEDRPRGVRTEDHTQRALLERYVRAWEAFDIDGFVSLLKEDATFVMPPWQYWYRGRDSIGAFFSKVWCAYRGFRLVATGANGQPAFALYSSKLESDSYHAHSLWVLDIQGDSISTLTGYVKPLGPELFVDFGFPLSPPAAQD
jgi:RNA polymerase sigma-70 factor, ECF subfamily